MTIADLNKIDQDIWGVVLIVFGGILLLIAVCLHAEHLEAIIGAIGSIIGAGAMAFKGGTKNNA